MPCIALLGVLASSSSSSLSAAGGQARVFHERVHITHRIGIVLVLCLILSSVAIVIYAYPSHKKPTVPAPNLASLALNNGCDPAMANVCAGSSLEGANLVGANLAGADLRHTDLSFANLQNASLAGADLTGANLQNANLAGANLTGANTASANMCGTIMPSGYVNDVDCSG